MADKLIDRIADAARPLLEGAGYDLADAEYVKEGANWYLRFYIERGSLDEPVGIDDCEKASGILSDWLDEHDPIPQAYFLEVSSPGIERQLKSERDFARFKGYMVEISGYKPEHGKKAHVGLLGTVSDNELSLGTDNGDMVFSRDNIASVKLYWDNEQGIGGGKRQ